MKSINFAWYARRARTMEPGELRARAVSALEGAVDLVRLRLSGKSGFEQSVNSGDFAFCRATGAMLPELEWKFEPSPSETGALLSGAYPALSHAWQWRAGGEAWHRAPDTGVDWPRGYSTLIAHRPGNPIGDVRTVWEPSRLQQLVSLALLARSSPEHRDDAVALLKQQLQCWVSANPVRRGVHYLSAMECALRIQSVAFASDLARPFLAGDTAYWSAVGKLVLEHAAFVHRRLSLYSSMGNHTVAESAGLLVAALLFPEHESAGAWEARAVEVLERATRRVIAPDGGAAEQALHYHAQVLDQLEIALRVARHFGRELGAIDQLYRAGVAFLGMFEADRATLPPVGDGDESHSLSPHRLPEWVGEGIRHKEQRDSANVSIDTRGGFSVARSRGDDATLIFNHGPLGMPPNYAHGHADALSVVLNVRNKPVLVDAGTYGYGVHPRWRNYFRSTAAHNTVTVDGLSQAQQAGPFLWTDPYHCELLQAETQPGRGATLTARHDGYAKLGVTHTRFIRMVPGSVVVTDRIEGEGSHALMLHWHCGGFVEGEGQTFWLKSMPSFRMVLQGGEISVLEASESPMGGWRSEIYGTISAISTLCVSVTATLPHEFTSIFTIGSEVAPGRAFAPARSVDRWERHDRAQNPAQQIDQAAIEAVPGSSGGRQTRS